MTIFYVYFLLFVLIFTLNFLTLYIRKTFDTHLNQITIPGAIFTDDQKDSCTELAFKYGVYRINKDKNILPKTTLIYDIQYVPRDDSFRATKKGLDRLVVIIKSSH